MLDFRELLAAPSLLWVRTIGPEFSPEISLESFAIDHGRHPSTRLVVGNKMFAATVRQSARRNLGVAPKPRRTKDERHIHTFSSEGHMVGRGSVVLLLR